MTSVHRCILNWLLTSPPVDRSVNCSGRCSFAIHAINRAVHHCCSVYLLNYIARSSAIDVWFFPSIYFIFRSFDYMTILCFDWLCCDFPLSSSTIYTKKFWKRFGLQPIQLQWVFLQFRSFYPFCLSSWPVYLLDDTILQILVACI